MAVAFRAGLLNIGAEGQLYVAAFATAWVGIVLRIVAGGRAASAVLRRGDCGRRASGARFPGLLKARFGSHEVINTIMMNFIAVALVELLHAVSLPDARRSDHADGADSAQRAHLRGSGNSFRGCPSAFR